MGGRAVCVAGGAVTLSLFPPTGGGVWCLSSSSDWEARRVVDGLGQLADVGAHYSRRTPGSKTFTGVGQEIVLVSKCGRAVWACVRAKVPAARGSGGTRGRDGEADPKATRFLFRNMVFRNLGAGLSSDLITEATERTYEEWIRRYGTLPTERLRTEIGCKEVRSTNPGYCYLVAGWVHDRYVRGKRYLWAPERKAVGATQAA